MIETYSLKTQGVSLALLQKLDSVRIGTNDDPTLKLLEMEDIARSLRSSHSQWQHLTESYVIGKFVNALPREMDIQKQMLEEREEGFSREAVVSSVQKRFDSFAYKQLRRSKSKSGEDQAFAGTGGGKNHPGRGGSRHGNRKPGGSQGGRGNGGSGGRGSSGGGASSGSSSAATAKPWGRTCWVCKSDQHYVRDCPKQICQGCGEKGHYTTKCGQISCPVGTFREGQTQSGVDGRIARVDCREDASRNQSRRAADQTGIGAGGDVRVQRGQRIKLP